MNDHPRITVVTPSYNQAHFLEATIRSVVEQGYPNLEYIIMDGGSTDGSTDVIRRYESFLSYWTSERDGGPANAINKGLSRATGSILAYLNSDDVYLPGTLDKIAAAFGSNPGASVAFGNTYWIDREGKVLAEKRQTPFSKVGYFYGGADLQQPSTFWTKDLYERSGGLDPTFRAAFDTDLFFRFVDLGAKFHYVPAFLASFRIHSEQISDVMLASARKELDKIRKSHLRYAVGSVPGTVLRNIGRLQRILWYAKQGDLGWMISRAPDRVRSRTSGEATGPRSKWI
jgi:glycosyltransferase involved in cell wall biosynthesis